MVGPRRAGLRVFAVEDTSVQLTWRRLGPGKLDVSVGGHHDRTAIEDGPGAVTIEGLRPEPDQRVDVSHIDLGRETVEFCTLPPPPGAELFRFATVSDLHIGIDHFDIRQAMPDLGVGGPAQPRVCAAAAIDEALAWGAQRIVVKGDITDKNRPRQWEEAAGLFADLDVPVDAILGNHDLYRRTDAIPAADIARRFGVPVQLEPTAIDVPGLRIVLCPTSIPGHSGGRIPRDLREATCDLLAEADGPALIVLHQQLQRLPLATYYPPGIPEPQASMFLRAVAVANPRAFLTSGHTHRHRRRQVGPLVVTEVGSPKDYPGTWAGYVVHEGGIRQVVKRVAEPAAIAWTEACRHAVFGVWGRWSPGRLADRCFSHTWPSRSRDGGCSRRLRSAAS